MVERDKPVKRKTAGIRSNGCCSMAPPWKGIEVGTSASRHLKLAWRPSEFVSIELREKRRVAIRRLLAHLDMFLDSTDGW